MTFQLTPGSATLEQLERIWREGLAVSLGKDARTAIDAASHAVAKAAAGDAAVYGVNTGFGKLASVRIKPADTAKLQRNLILSHCCGVGEPLEVKTTRLMMVLKLLSVGRGASGIRWKTIELLQNLLTSGITPLIPTAVKTTISLLAYHTSKLSLKPKRSLSLTQKKKHTHIWFTIW